MPLSRRALPTLGAGGSQNESLGESGRSMSDLYPDNRSVCQSTGAPNPLSKYAFVDMSLRKKTDKSTSPDWESFRSRGAWYWIGCVTR